MQTGVIFSRPKAGALDRLVSEGEHETTNSRPASRGGVSLFQYVLKSDWANNEATADIYRSVGAGDGTLVAENQNIYDPRRQSIMQDQEAGDPGWCHRQPDGYYAWQGSCEGSGGDASGSTELLPIDPDTVVPN